MIRNMFFRKESDPTVCISFPKSGRTWVRFAMHVAGANVRFSHAGYGTKGVEEIGELFEELKTEHFGKRNVLLYRNPLDVAVSMFYQINNRNFAPTAPDYDAIRDKLVELDRLPPPTIDAFVLDPVWGCGNIAAFNRAHLNHFADQDDFLAVRYEDLAADPHTHFSRLLDFARVKGYDIERVVEDSSFNKMRALEMRADHKQRREHKLYGLKDSDENTLKVRKGTVRGYVDVLQPETIEQAAKICADFGLKI